MGVIVQACTENKNYVLAGRFVTGLGVGSLSMVVPLYNAELAPPEVRGSLVAVQQLAITFGIMVSFWVSVVLRLLMLLTNIVSDWVRHQLYRRDWRDSIQCGLAHPHLYSSHPCHRTCIRHGLLHASITKTSHQYREGR